MIRDRYNIIPLSMAALLHGLFVASLIVVFDFSRPVTAAMPLAIQATLVTTDELDSAPPPPEIVAPEPEPDNSEQQRIEAEEQMRLAELAKEQQRIKELDDAERKRKAREAEERRRREDAELERKRVEAEKKRVADLERQRLENERLRKEALAAEAAALAAAEIAREDERLAAMNSSAMAQYSLAIQRKIERNWARPASAKPGIECVIDVRQLRGGEVIIARVGRCNGDAAVMRTIEAAVFKASPLPVPSDPNLFSPDLRIIFKPEE